MSSSAPSLASTNGSADPALTASAEPNDSLGMEMNDEVDDGATDIVVKTECDPEDFSHTHSNALDSCSSADNKRKTVESKL